MKLKLYTVSHQIVDFGGRVLFWTTLGLVNKVNANTDNEGVQLTERGQQFLDYCLAHGIDGELAMYKDMRTIPEDEWRARAKRNN